MDITRDYIILKIRESDQNLIKLQSQLVLEKNRKRVLQELLTSEPTVAGEVETRNPAANENLDDSAAKPLYTQRIDLASRKRKTSKNWQLILAFMSDRRVVTAEILEFARNHGITLSTGTIRGQMCHFRKKNIVAQSDGKIGYRLTPAAALYYSQIKKEAKGDGTDASVLDSV